jgi:DNA repair protein RadC
MAGGDGLAVVSRYRLALVREAAEPYQAPPCCLHADEAAAFFHRIAGDLPFECAGALLLDSTHRPIGHVLPYTGALEHVTVEPRGFLSAALLGNAAGLTLFHCHPSGDPTPTFSDLDFTRRMVWAGELVGVRVLDHLVLGAPPRYVSIRQLSRGRWPPPRRLNPWGCKPSQVRRREAGRP